MSGSQITTASPNEPQLAFDYVTGVMRGGERKRFAQRLVNDLELRAQVNYWEEELMRLSDREQALKPADNTWGNISARLNRTSTLQPVFWLRWFWQGASAFSLVEFALFVWVLSERPLLPNADYVAVLTDERGAPSLTVLTAAGGEQLWLKWGVVEIAPDMDLQLWAISKRDGQIRPLGVFSATDAVDLSLSVAQLRLIKDASHLLLTEEDVGGSPLDEPSEIIIAKGVCVLLATTEKSI
ncbi:anti-sigma factor [Idiomarina sp. UBA4206]|uniref:anti-sigma factor n=1 Tax=Idiomarina sp. UBA4206 TaxID=1946644 RepID=UPI002580555B|nr:anti-sigma factor [Idiomarina sp. UBA4206]